MAEQRRLARVERASGWGELVLDRPARRNALITELVVQLRAGLAELAADENLGAIVLRGEGRCFCSGLDLHELASQPDPRQRTAFGAEWAGLHLELAACPVPTIAALEGAAIAAGSALALACDFMIAGRTATLHVSEVGRAMTPPMNVAWLVSKFGSSRALELAVAAEPHDGVDLFRLGIALSVVEDHEVLENARNIAQRFGSYDRSALVETKSMVRRASGQDFAKVLEQVQAGPAAEP